MQFTVQIPVKKYIKAYLENNCGSPADLSHLPDIKDMFEGCLMFPRFNRDKHIKCNYTDSVDIYISNDHFYRYGWQLSKTDTIRFNQKCEAFIKFNSRQFILANHSMGMPVSVCIREFQSIYQFDEDSFSFQTIKKDFERHGSKITIHMIRDFRAELNNILMDNLSNLGTISKSFVNERNSKI